jgi:hypothetical protein
VKKKSDIKLFDWQQIKINEFWGTVASYGHVLQVYEKEESFINTLAGFVGTGINAGEASVVIATARHLEQLEHKLTSYGLHIGHLKDDERYIPLNAEETLSGFMVNGLPDAQLFHQAITQLFGRAAQRKRKLRAFGEMVALLWARGMHDATHRLEELWNDSFRQQPFSLFCAYPKLGFVRNLEDVKTRICNHHSQLIVDADNSVTDILYKRI